MVNQLLCLRRCVLLFVFLIFISQVCVFFMASFFLFLLSPFVLKKSLTRYPQGSILSLYLIKENKMNPFIYYF